MTRWVKMNGRLGATRNLNSGEDYERTQEERKTNAPERLPRLRPRALTLDSDIVLEHTSTTTSASIQQIQACDQSQSIIFARLAREIRQLIWTEVLGGHFLHIARTYGKLLAIACTEDRGITRHIICWGSTHRCEELAPTPGLYHHHGSYNPARPADFLPLLRTCRRIYMETILIPYTDNTFDINHIDTLIYLQRSVLPQRLNQISVMNMTWKFKLPPATSPVPYDLATWNEACNILADNFAGLRELSIYISGSGIFGRGLESKDQWGPVLGALMPIKAKKFEVFVPFSTHECIEAAKEGYPFRLVSHYGDRGVSSGWYQAMLGP